MQNMHDAYKMVSHSQLHNILDTYNWKAQSVEVTATPTPPVETGILLLSLA